jgi:hypothetical protein
MGAVLARLVEFLASPEALSANCRPDFADAPEARRRGRPSSGFPSYGSCSPAGVAGAEAWFPILRSDLTEFQLLKSASFSRDIEIV